MVNREQITAVITLLTNQGLDDFRMGRASNDELTRRTVDALMPLFEADARFIAHLQASLAEAQRLIAQLRAQAVVDRDALVYDRRLAAVRALCGGPLSLRHEPYVAEQICDGNVEFVVRLDDLRAAVGWEEDLDPDG